jgi:hypothetical protein
VHPLEKSVDDVAGDKLEAAEVLEGSGVEEGG